jgi:hypothetical protein
MRLQAGFSVVLAACAACHAAGSGGGPGPAASATVAPPATPSAAATPASSSSYRVHAVPDGRAVEVHLVYAGKPHAAWPIPATFASHCGGAAQVADPSLEVDAKGGVTGAVAWLDDVHEGEPLPSGDVVVDQKGCAFTPHVLAMPAGGKLHVTNGDPANHALRFEIVGGSDDESVVKMLPPGGNDVVATSPAWAGHVAHITCPIHAWMFGWAHLFDHPYFAVTRGGVARIEKVPPGTWHLSVGHEALDAKPGDTGVAQGTPTRARFDVTLADKDVVKTLTLREDGTIR